MVQATISFSPVNLTTLTLQPFQTAAAGALSGSAFPQGSNVSVITYDFTVVGTYTLTGSSAGSLVGSATYAATAAQLVQNLLQDSPTVAVSVQVVAAGGRRLLQSSATVVVTAARIGSILSQAQSINNRLANSPLVTGQIATAAAQVAGGAAPTVSVVSTAATATLAVQVTVSSAGLGAEYFQTPLHYVALGFLAITALLVVGYFAQHMA